MHLLPPNASELEKAFSNAADFSPRLDPPVTIMRGLKYIGTPPEWLPFLIYEYGLGELSPYVPDQWQLIRKGIAWQRVRGTPGAISRGLDWIGYGATLEEPPIRRKRWHLLQLELDRTRDAEEPDLERIEAVTQLSVPLRTHFWRGYHTYDVRALEYGYTRTSETLIGDYSGVRIAPDHAKWSFGRLYEHEYTLTEADLTALGVWIAPVPEVVVQGWEAVEWPDSAWSAIDALERQQAIIDAIYAMTAWVTFVNADGDVIGHRRARAWHRTKLGSTSAPYIVGQNRRAIADAGDATGLYIEVMTGFSDGYGHTAAKWQVRLGATLADPTRPGLLWAQPDELVGGVVAAEKTDTIEFGRTVRERCRALLRVV